MINLAYFKEIVRTRSKTLIVLLAIFILNILLATFMSMYQRPRLESLQSEWFNKRKVAGTVLDRGSAFDQGNADLARWNALIAPKKELARIVSDIFSIAKTNSLSLGGISYKPEQIKSEKLLAYVIGLTVSGRYAAVKSFIGDLGLMRDIVTIDDISLNNPKLTEELVSLKLNLTVYLRPEGQ